MRAALVLKGGPTYPDRGKLELHKIERLYYEANDTAVSQHFLDELRAVRLVSGRKLEVGIMRDPGWEDDGPEELADKLSDDLNRLATPSRGADLKQCAVLADIETHDPAAILRWLRHWRSTTGARRTTRETAWTLEPFQGGWVTPELAIAVNNDVNLTVIHQNYLGTPRMFPVAADAARTNLTTARISAAALRGFYDGELAALVADRAFASDGVRVSGLPDRWDGIVYNFNALPA